MSMVFSEYKKTKKRGAHYAASSLTLSFFIYIFGYLGMYEFKDRLKFFCWTMKPVVIFVQQVIM